MDKLKGRPILNSGIIVRIKPGKRNFVNFFAGCLAVLFLFFTISCKKNKQVEEDIATTNLSENAKELSLNKYAKNINGTYGVLTADQRFESTDIIQLDSGILIAALSNTFESFNKTSVFKCYSYDNGLSWSSPKEINLPPSGYKFTATNLFKLKSRLYLVMNRLAENNSTCEGGIPAISYSDDKGITWSKPQLMLQGNEREIVIMNSRNITITKSGRIIIPVGNGQMGTHGYRISLIYSDNYGRSWNESPNLFNGINTRQAKFAEPSIGQLNDGRLIMLIRTALGHIYKSYSSDNGSTWSYPECTSLVSPWTAHSIRVTKNGYIIVAYTNTISRNDKGYPRNNLKFAVSYDNGETWKPSGTIIEIPESSEFLMEPNITRMNNDKYLVTYFRQLKNNVHRIETAIFNHQAVLREEENWADLRWWWVSGNGTASAVNSKLHLNTNSNSRVSVYKSQLIANSYELEFKSKINSFIHPGYADDYATLLLKVANGSYKLLFKLESDGFHLKDKNGVWTKHSNPAYLNSKSDWHVWKFAVSGAKVSVFMDEVNVLNNFDLATASNEPGSISFSSRSNLVMKSDCFIDYTYYDPL
jgi:sialidase-1